MGRVWHSGFELNSTSSGMEYTATSGVGTVFTIVTSPVRSGTYAAKFLANNSSVGQARFNFASSDQNGQFYLRVYIRIDTIVSAATNILIMRNNANADKIGIRLNTDNTLTLRNLEDSASIGSDSAALNTGQWYRIEIAADTTTPSSTAVAARVDGVEFASGSANLATGLAALVLGFSTVFATGEVYMDDVALNDSSGSFQNSYPGSEKIINIRADSAGDSNQLGSAASTNYQQIDEITPDDASTIIDIGADAADDTDDYNLSASGIGASDVVNVVLVGVRYGASASSSNDSFAVRIKDSSGGSVEESADITPTATAYTTNANGTPKLYPLTSYNLPGASTDPWTQATLDTAQIGIRKTVAAANDTRISALWLSIGYTPYVEPPPPVSFNNYLAVNVGDGMSTGERIR